MEFQVKNTGELFEALKEKGEKKIFVKKGTYEIEKTIVLDSDTEIIGEEGAVFWGSKRISLKNIKPEGKVYKIKLSDYGIDDLGAFGLGPFRDFWKDYDIPKPHMDDYGPSLELYYGSKKMNLTRYPKKGFSYIKEAVGETGELDPHGRMRSRKEGFFIPCDHKPFLENDVSEMLLIGYWNWDWATQRHLVDSYDKETGVVKVNEPYHVYGYAGNKIGHYYALNLKSELKCRGDWFIDRKEGTLYVIPFENQNYVDVTVAENMFEAQGKKNIKISGISVMKCRKSAFKFLDCDNITLSGATVTNVGAWAAIVDRCTNSTVTGFNIAHVGGGGISLSGGDRNTLTPSNNVASYNIITDVATWHKMCLAGIEINGVVVTVSHNKIHDVVHSAIMWQGNDHVIEYNEIANASYEANDAGAVYAGRDYTCRGMIIRYNYIHDLFGYQNKGCAGLYFDDGLSSAEVYGNTFANITNMAILLGGGRDFNIHDNYFFNCGAAMTLDDRYFTWAKNSLGPDGNLMRHLHEVPYRSEIWKNKYPELYTILDDEPREPRNNRFNNNTILGGGGVRIANREGFESFLAHSGNTLKASRLVGIPEKIVRSEATEYIDFSKEQK